jgi:hypothetical protein
VDEAIAEQQDHLSSAKQRERLPAAMPFSLTSSASPPGTGGGINTKRRVLAAFHFLPGHVAPPMMLGCAVGGRKGRMPASAWPWTARSTAADVRNRHDAVPGVGQVAVAGRYRNRQPIDLPHAVARPTDDVRRVFLT